MVSCREFLELMLDAWLQHQLPRRRQRACDAHVARCRECADYVASYRATVQALVELGALEPTTDVPEDLVQAILSQN